MNVDRRTGTVNKVMHDMRKQARQKTKARTHVEHGLSALSVFLFGMAIMYIFIFGY